jgi:hypothetical protein
VVRPVKPLARPRREKRPRAVFGVLVIAWFHAALAFLSAAGLQDELARGRVEDSGAVQALVVVAWTVCAVQAVSGLLAVFRLPWVWRFAVVGQGLCIVALVVEVFLGASVGVLLIAALPAVVLRMLLSRELTDWYHRRAS